LVAKRFEVAAPARAGEAETWRVTLRQLAILGAVGALIIAAIGLIEGRSIFDLESAGRSQALQLEGQLGPGPKVGEVAPDFSLATLSGEPLRLSALKGKPVLVNFWATWCPPCRAEMPDLDEVARANAAGGLQVVAVNLKEEPDAVGAYLRTIGVGLAAVLDRDGNVFRQYRISGLPTTVAIDRDGIVREIHVGPLTRKGIEGRVARIT
jgi:thiol-disulfide isomerase/thioredoxin